ncbi:MAG: response regulator transcription factor, partial [Ruaniaceae bacterium]|nr:response regulator transcription factor [Ruaniaceae bacterium]
RVASGDAVMAPQVTRRMLERMGAAPEAPVPSPHTAFAAVPAQPTTAPSGTAHTTLEALTEREREVLALIGEGLNNAEISERLFLSESTVKTHVGRVLFKLELRDRIHAVILAKELGL